MVGLVLVSYGRHKNEGEREEEAVGKGKKRRWRGEEEGFYFVDMIHFVAP